MSSKAVTTPAGQKSSLKLKKKQQQENVIVQAPEGLQGAELAPEQTVATQRPTQDAHDTLLTAAVAGETSPVAEEAVRGEVAQAEAVLTAVGDGVDVSANSLLVAAASRTAKKEDDDDRGGWLWSDTLPWVAVLGGVALAGGSDKDGASGSSGGSGLVWDTPVANAIVFRDSDGDGMWKDVNGDGIWQAGDESIVSTDENGYFTGLGGSGLIVATSVDRLVSTNGKSGDQQVLTRYSRSDVITTQSGQVTGDAIDIGADQVYGTADDYVWSGAYVAPEGSGIYVTGVSTLVAAYLREQGVTSPTQAQVITAANELAQRFASDYEGGAITSYAQAIEFFTGSLNAQITKLMGAVAGQAAAEDADVLAAVNAAVATLAQAAINLSGSNEGMDVEFGEDNLINLTDSVHLQEIYGYNALQADAYAAQTANAGPAVYTIWFTEDGSAVASPSFESIATLTNDGPIGNITVLTRGEGTSADLTVEPTEGVDALTLQGSHILVQAAGDGSAADLTLTGATGTLTEVTVRADGDVGTVSGGGSSWRNYIVDGGSDQYDDGNYIGTWTKAEYDLAVSLDTVSTDIYPTSVAYSGTVADDNFGTGSQNVAVYQDSIFGMLVKGNTSDTFTVTGETGSDGSGSEDTLTLAEYNGYQAIVIRTYGDDPSINRVFIYKADAGVSAASLDDDTDTEDFFISGLSAVDDFGYFVVYGDSTSDPIPEADLETFFHAAVDDVMSAGSVEEMKTAFYDADTQTALRGSMQLYTEFTNDEYSVDGAFTLQSGDVAVSADSMANATIDFSGDLQGNLSVLATGENADASLNLHSTSGEVNLQGGDINVTASGTDSNATAAISNVSGHASAVDVLASATSANASANISGDLSVDGNVGVTASAEYADAHLTLTDASSTDTFSGGNISVTASGASADAGATMNNVSGSVGAVNVTASGYSGDAHLNLDVREEGLLQAASLTVTASAESADASADISGNMAITGDLGVTASEVLANARATLSGDLSVDGDVTVTASAESGDAHLTLTDASSTDTFSGGNIGVTASGASADASATMNNVSGFVDAISVTASGYSGDAHLNLDVKEEGLLQAASLTVEATDQSADARADLTGDIAITGDVSVDATASNADARANINASGSGATVLGGDGVDNFVTVSADVADATATLNIGNAQGSIYQLDVTANDGTASLDVGVGEDQTLTIAKANVTSNGTGHAEASLHGDEGSTVAITGDITVSADGALDPAELYVNSATDGATVLGTGEDTAVNEVTVTARTGAEAYAYLNNTSGRVDDLRITAESGDADAGLDVAVAADAALTVDRVEVTASDSGDNAEAYLWTRGANSELTVNGNIEVKAQGSDAYAYAEINRLEWTMSEDGSWTSTDATGHLVLGGVDIVVEASGDDADASADIRNASGSVGSLEVSASSSDAVAALTLRTESYNGTDGITADHLNVTASANSAVASADISGDVAITGAISVTASGDNADATADINTDSSGHTVLGVAGEAEVVNISYAATSDVVDGHLITTITASAEVEPGTAAVGSELTVTASCADAAAAADIRNASGFVTDILVTASGESSDAALYLQTESHNGVDGVTAASLAVTASGDDADASADISGDVAITGAVSITASAEGADATANLNTSGSGRTVLGVAATPEIAIETTVLVDAQIVETRTEVVRAGTAAVGSDLTVTASGASADASADLRNVSGIVEDIVVTASGICSDAYLNLHIEDGEWLQAASLTVQADVYADESSNDAEAVISGNITIAGDIIVSGGDDVDADINTDGAGHTVLGGGNITVTADGDDSDADADIRNASGTVGDIRVTAGDLGDDADADLNLATESYDGVDGVTAASLTVEALGDSTDATAEINGVIAFTGDLRVVASDDSADASAHINTGGGADEYQEFFLPAVFGINGWSYASGDVLDVVVDGYTLSYTIGSFDSPWSWAQSLNAQADNLGLAVDFGMCGDVVLEAQWHDGRNHDLLQFSHNGNTGELADWYIEQDGFSANASTVLGANGGASDITVSATSASADADAYIYQVSGSAGSIEVLAHGYDADAYLDLRVASGEQLESGNITVIASDTDGTAQIDINGNLVVNGDISVSAAGDASSADAEINNVGFSSSEDTVYAGETRLQGGDISVTASGDSADARAWVHNASGTLGDLNVVASDTGANATLDLRAQATGQHQLQIITLTEAELSALAERDTLGVWIDGTYFEADLAHAYYTSNSDKLAEFVQAIRDDGNYADLNADVYQDGNSLVIRWHDYENHAAPRQVQINGVNRGFSQSVNAVAPSLAFDNSSDVWVSASSSDAQAHAAVDSVAGTLGNTYVFASGDSNAHASLTMGLNGDLSGDVVVVADGVYNSATLDLHADASGRISLGSFNCQDVVVAAHGLGAQADASLSGLSGTLDDLTVVADVKNAEASANLQFAEGSLNYACMDAVDHQSTVRVTLDQTVRNGDVYVAGEGHAAVSFYVDERNATADQVNLWGMHNGDRSYHERGGDWWGYADIDLVARYNDVLDQPGAGLQTSCNDTLWDTRMTVYGFNVERDSINVIVQADDCGHLGTQDQLVRHDVAFLHEGDTTVAEAAFDAAIDDLLADARWYFDNYTGDAEQGYYYRQITLDPDVGSNYVRSFLVYDYDLGGDNVGASGLVALSDTTGLNERNVADRYDIVSQTEGYVSQSTDLAGAHAIDSLTVGAYEDGQNDQTYVVSHDADVMVSDITVEAINPGLGYGWDDTAYASLNMASRASVGCGDSWLELRQSDVNVIARGDDGEYAYADAYLSLRDAWGTLNSVTVEANNNAQASADLAYLSYWSDYDSLGSVKVHDMDVRAMDDNADATLSTVSSDLTFDYSVVNVTAGYDAQGNAEGAYESDARLYVNRYVDGDHRCGDVDGVISELNVRVDGTYSSASADLHRYAGDIGLLRVTADGYHSSADADVLFDNSMGAVNAVHEIYVRADGEGTDARASIDTTSSSNDIQLTGGDIYVGAFDSADASLDMTSAPLSGQASQIVVEANDSADARAWISGHDFSVTHERTSTDTWNDSSIRVSAGADSDARLAISGYGQYLDSVVLAAGESSDVYFSLDMTGFIDTLDIQVTGDNSYVSADIAQATYGGVVNVDGSANYYSSDALDEVIHENNVVDLAYRTATASEINIDNTGRDFERGGYAYDGGWYFASGDYDDTLQLNLLLDVADQDIPYTSQATLLAYRVQIDGWTDNDTISFAGESGDAGYNYEENWSEVSLTQLFRDADAALDGTVDYYFGVSAGNGYLFHDEDGTGITTVVELLGVTAFDDHQIRGTLIT